MVGQTVIIKGRFIILSQVKNRIKMIKIELKIGGVLILESKFIELAPYAPTTIREFVFKDVCWLSQDENCFEDAKLLVNVFYFSNLSVWKYYTEFEILVNEYKVLNNKELKISGLINQDYADKEYRQGVTNIFKLWDESKTLDWAFLPIGDYLKHEYITACFIYNGISESILEKSNYEIDMAFVKEDLDFYYLASLTFIGEKGYFGHNLDSFDDCLLTIFHKRNENLFGIKVSLLNCDSIPIHLYSFRLLIRDIILKYRMELIES